MQAERRVLVIDDDQTIRDSLAAILKDEGYDVDEAEDGGEAIKKTKKRTYNAALIDIKLPDISGIELLTRLKDSHPKMKKIILTGFPSQQNAIAALNDGADAFLVKPVEVQKMLEILRKQLDKQKQEVEVSQDSIAKFIKTKIKDLDSSS